MKFFLVHLIGLIGMGVWIAGFFMCTSGTRTRLTTFPNPTAIPSSRTRFPNGTQKKCDNVTGFFLVPIRHRNHGALLRMSGVHLRLDNPGTLRPETM